jgi:hypothetical protein
VGYGTKKSCTLRGSCSICNTSNRKALVNCTSVPCKPCSL